MNNQKIMMLSLWQPWASLCIWKNADGKAEKQIETRHWKTNYRGLLAIHATKTITTEAKFEVTINSVMQETLLSRNIHYSEIGRCLPLGAIVGIVELVGIRTFESDGAHSWVDRNYPKREQSFGNFETGRFGWLLQNPIEFSEPIVCRGSQGLGGVSPEIREQIFNQIEV
jgi:hypothetical protein